MNPNEALVLARREMDAHGLSHVALGWSPRAVRRLGVCKFRREVSQINPRQIVRKAFQIELSIKLVRVNPVEVVLNTIRHEIAHALAGFEAGHGWHWKAHALKIGADPERACSDAVKLPGKYVLSCGACSWSTERHRRPKQMNVSCPKCSRGRYNPAFALALVVR
jgi:hypothetical protein